MLVIPKFSFDVGVDSTSWSLRIELVANTLRKLFMKGEAYIQDSLTLRLIKYHCYMVSDFAFTGDP